MQPGRFRQAGTFGYKWVSIPRQVGWLIVERIKFQVHAARRFLRAAAQDFIDDFLAAPFLFLRDHFSAGWRAGWWRTWFCAAAFWLGNVASVAATLAAARLICDRLHAAGWIVRCAGCCGDAAGADVNGGRQRWGEIGGCLYRVEPLDEACLVPSAGRGERAFACERGGGFGARIEQRCIGCSAGGAEAWCRLGAACGQYLRGGALFICARLGFSDGGGGGRDLGRGFVGAGIDRLFAAACGIFQNLGCDFLWRAWAFGAACAHECACA